MYYLRLIELANTVMGIVLISIYLKGLFQSYKVKTPAVLLSYIAVCIGISLLSLVPNDSPFITVIRLGSTFLIIILLARFLFGTKWLSALYSALLFCAIVTIIDIFCFGILIKIFGVQPEDISTFTNTRIWYLVLTILLELFCVYLVIKLSRWRRSQESLVSAVPLLMCQVFSIFICYIMYLGTWSGTSAVTVDFIIGSVGILYINVVIFVFVERIKEVSEIKKQNALAEQQYRSKLEYFEQVKDDQEMTRALWHDIKKYLNTMNDLMNASDIVHAKECISQVSDLFEDIGKVVDVGNTVVSAVLNHSVQKAHRMNIDVDLDVRVRSDLNVSAADLSIIIGNTFDNAIEAAAITTVENKRIKVSLIEKDTLLFYEITNPYDPNAPEQKKDRKQHGFGLKNVKRCVDKYKGSMNLEKRGGEFMVTIHLNIPAETTGTLLAS